MSSHQSPRDQNQSQSPPVSNHSTYSTTQSANLPLQPAPRASKQQTASQQEQTQFGLSVVPRKPFQSKSKQGQPLESSPSSLQLDHRQKDHQYLQNQTSKMPHPSNPLFNDSQSTFDPAALDLSLQSLRTPHYPSTYTTSQSIPNLSRPRPDINSSHSLLSLSSSVSTRSAASLPLVQPHRQSITSRRPISQRSMLSNAHLISAMNRSSTTYSNVALSTAEPQHAQKRRQPPPGTDKRQHSDQASDIASSSAHGLTKVTNLQICSGFAHKAVQPPQTQPNWAHYTSATHSSQPVLSQHGPISQEAQQDTNLDNPNQTKFTEVSDFSSATIQPPPVKKTRYILDKNRRDTTKKRETEQHEVLSSTLDRPTAQPAPTSPKSKGSDKRPRHDELATEAIAEKTVQLGSKGVSPSFLHSTTTGGFPSRDFKEALRDDQDGAEHIDESTSTPVKSKGFHQISHFPSHITAPSISALETSDKLTSRTAHRASIIPPQSITSHSNPISSRSSTVQSILRNEDLELSSESQDPCKKTKQQEQIQPSFDKTRDKSPILRQLCKSSSFYPPNQGDQLKSHNIHTYPLQISRLLQLPRNQRQTQPNQFNPAPTQHSPLDSQGISSAITQMIDFDQFDTFPDHFIHPDPNFITNASTAIDTAVSHDETDFSDILDLNLDNLDEYLARKMLEHSPHQTHSITDQGQPQKMPLQQMQGQIDTQTSSQLQLTLISSPRALLSPRSRIVPSIPQEPTQMSFETLIQPLNVTTLHQSLSLTSQLALLQIHRTQLQTAHSQLAIMQNELLSEMITLHNLFNQSLSVIPDASILLNPKSALTRIEKPACTGGLTRYASFFEAFLTQYREKVQNYSNLKQFHRISLFNYNLGLLQLKQTHLSNQMIHNQSVIWLTLNAFSKQISNHYTSSITHPYVSHLLSTIPAIPESIMRKVAPHINIDCLSSDHHSQRSQSLKSRLSHSRESKNSRFDANSDRMTSKQPFFFISPSQTLCYPYNVVNTRNYVTELLSTYPLIPINTSYHLDLQLDSAKPRQVPLQQQSLETQEGLQRAHGVNQPSLQQPIHRLPQHIQSHKSHATFLPASSQTYLSAHFHTQTTPLTICELPERYQATHWPFSQNINKIANFPNKPNPTLPPNTAPDFLYPKPHQNSFHSRSTPYSSTSAFNRPILFPTCPFNPSTAIINHAYYANLLPHQDRPTMITLNYFEDFLTRCLPLNLVTFTKFHLHNDNTPLQPPHKAGLIASLAKCSFYDRISLIAPETLIQAKRQMTQFEGIVAATCHVSCAFLATNPNLAQNIAFCVGFGAQQLDLDIQAQKSHFGALISDPATKTAKLGRRSDKYDGIDILLASLPNPSSFPPLFKTMLRHYQETLYSIFVEIINHLQTIQTPQAGLSPRSPKQRQQHSSISPHSNCLNVLDPPDYPSIAQTLKGFSQTIYARAASYLSSLDILSSAQNPQNRTHFLTPPSKSTSSDHSSSTTHNIPTPSQLVPKVQIYEQISLHDRATVINELFILTLQHRFPLHHFYQCVSFFDSILLSYSTIPLSKLPILMIVVFVVVAKLHSKQQRFTYFYFENSIDLQVLRLQQHDWYNMQTLVLRSMCRAVKGGVDLDITKLGLTEAGLADLTSFPTSSTSTTNSASSVGPVGSHRSRTDSSSGNALNRSIFGNLLSLVNYPLGSNSTPDGKVALDLNRTHVRDKMEQQDDELKEQQQLQYRRQPVAPSQRHFPSPFPQQLHTQDHLSSMKSKYFALPPPIASKDLLIASSQLHSYKEELKRSNPTLAQQDQHIIAQMADILKYFAQDGFNSFYLPPDIMRSFVQHKYQRDEIVYALITKSPIHSQTQPAASINKIPLHMQASKGDDETPTTGSVTNTPQKSPASQSRSPPLLDDLPQPHPYITYLALLNKLKEAQENQNIPPHELHTFANNITMWSVLWNQLDQSRVVAQRQKEIQDKLLQVCWNDWEMSNATTPTPTGDIGSERDAQRLQERQRHPSSVSMSATTSQSSKSQQSQQYQQSQQSNAQKHSLPFQQPQSVTQIPHTSPKSQFLYLHMNPSSPLIDHTLPLYPHQSPLYFGPTQWFRAKYSTNHLLEFRPPQLHTFHLYVSQPPTHVAPVNPLHTLSQALISLNPDVLQDWNNISTNLSALSLDPSSLSPLIPPAVLTMLQKTQSNNCFPSILRHQPIDHTTSISAFGLSPSQSESQTRRHSANQLNALSNKEEKGNWADNLQSDKGQPKSTDSQPPQDPQERAFLKTRGSSWTLDNQADQAPRSQLSQQRAQNQNDSEQPQPVSSSLFPFTLTPHHSLLYTPFTLSPAHPHMICSDPILTSNHASINMHTISDHIDSKVLDKLHIGKTRRADLTFSPTLRIPLPKHNKFLAARQHLRQIQQVNKVQYQNYLDKQAKEDQQQAQLKQRQQNQQSQHQHHQGSRQHQQQFEDQYRSNSSSFFNFFAAPSSTHPANFDFAEKLHANSTNGRNAQNNEFITNPHQTSDCYMHPLYLQVLEGELDLSYTCPAKNIQNYEKTPFSRDTPKDLREPTKNRSDFDDIEDILRNQGGQMTDFSCQSVSSLDASFIADCLGTDVDKTRNAFKGQRNLLDTTTSTSTSSLSSNTITIGDLPNQTVLSASTASQPALSSLSAISCNLWDKLMPKSGCCAKFASELGQSALTNDTIYTSTRSLESIHRHSFDQMNDLSLDSTISIPPSQSCLSRPISPVLDLAALLVNSDTFTAYADIRAWETLIAYAHPHLASALSHYSLYPQLRRALSEQLLASFTHDCDHGQESSDNVLNIEPNKPVPIWSPSATPSIPHPSHQPSFHAESHFSSIPSIRSNFSSVSNLSSKSQKLSVRPGSQHIAAWLSGDRFNDYDVHVFTPNNLLAQINQAAQFNLDPDATEKPVGVMHVNELETSQPQQRNHQKQQQRFSRDSLGSFSSTNHEFDPSNSFNGHSDDLTSKTNARARQSSHPFDASSLSAIPRLNTSTDSVSLTYVNSTLDAPLNDQTQAIYTMMNDDDPIVSPSSSSLIRPTPPHPSSSSLVIASSTPNPIIFQRDFFNEIYATDLLSTKYLQDSLTNAGRLNNTLETVQYQRIPELLPSYSPYPATDTHNLFFNLGGRHARH